jgi:2-oxoglutarate ferredoxin oxidoreductase subunit delta
VKAVMALAIKPKLCKGCGICVHFCPKAVLDLDEMGKIYAKDPDKCIICGQCELRCPDYAIKVTKEEKTSTKTDGGAAK